MTSSVNAVRFLNTGTVPEHRPIVPGFEIAERLHDSGRTSVYRGRRTADDLHVVIKLPSDGFAAEYRIKQLHREYSLGCLFDSDSVIRFLEMVPYQGGVALIEEDHNAVALSAIIPENGMSVALFLDIAIQLAGGLAHIHDQHVVHKDIKPDNIVVSQEHKNVKFIDFGIASKLSREYQPEAREIEGTLAYVSPEQTGRMNRPVDFRTDFYSLGITFFEMLIGHPPFRVGDPLEIVHNHIALVPPSVHEIREEVPRTISSIVAKLLEKNAEARYQSGGGLKADLIRCRQNLKQGGSLETFELATRDYSDRFRIPSRLYGREFEVSALLRAFERASKGAAEVLMVSGPSGIGKTVLVREIHRDVSAHRGRFVAGKFDELNQGLAYGAIRQAIAKLADQILGENDQEVDRWRARIRSVLGPAGSLLTTMLPEMKPLLEGSASEDSVEPSQSPNRFRPIFRDFISALATREHPLVVFLDDLQWADAATLDLLEMLLGHEKTRHFLLIGAYREEEVSADHPLMKSLEVLEKKRVRLTRIELAALKARHLRVLLSDTLKCEGEAITELAEVVAGKTGGNHFYTYELLKELYRRNVLCFSKRESRWIWKLEEVGQIDARENVLAFMIDRLNRLPAATRESLRMATCLGNEFSLITLAFMLGRPQVQVARDLLGALDREIIIPIDMNYRLADLDRVGRDDLEVRYRFQHDRVRQAAYALIKEDEKAGHHLAVGRSLRELWQDHEGKLLALTGHLNAGRYLMGDLKERLALAKLNLAAGRKTLGSAAYASAFSYFQIGFSLLGSRSWSRHYELAFALAFHLAESASLLGDTAAAKAQWITLSRMARTDLEKARIIDARLDPNTETPANVLKAGTRGLRLLGFDLPKKPGRSYIAKQLADVWASLGDREIADLEQLPFLTDPSMSTALSLLGKLTLASYYEGNTKLWSMVIIERVRLTLGAGLNSEAVHAFTSFGVMLCSELSDFRAGEAFGRLALKLAERFPYATPRCKINFLYIIFIHHWQVHWKNIPNFLKMAVESGLQSGDTVFASLACSQLTHWDPTISLETAVLEGQKYHVLLESRFPGRGQVFMFQQYRRNLQGQTQSRFSFSDANFNEEESFKTLQRLGLKSNIALFKLLKIQVYYIFENYGPALRLLQEVDPIRDTMKGLPSYVEYCFYSFLVTAALLPTTQGPARDKAWRRLRMEYRQMESWARLCPVNFQHRHLLMEAEMARLSAGPNGKYGVLATLYHAAIQSAAEGEWRHNEALSLMLAARFNLERGMERYASGLMSEALLGFAHWGAHAVVAHLRQTYPRLLIRVRDVGFRESPTLKATIESDAFTRTTNPRDTWRGLDLASALKSCYALISEIDYDKLLDKMMRIIIENVGAQKGALIMDADGELRLEATAQLGAGNDCRSPSLPLERCSCLPKKLVRLVFRSSRQRVLGNAVEEDMFHEDPYIRENNIKSVLCMPVRYQDRTTGVLYLENNLVTDAFTSQRVALIQVLLVQAAISLENARLFGETRRAEREVRRLNRDLERLNEQLELRVVQRTAQLEEAQKNLLGQAHRAGMSEIATSVLHNVGNILNSVLTSCQVIRSCLDNSKTAGLHQANAMLHRHIDHIEDFISNDPRGKSLLLYYLAMDKPLLKERDILNNNVHRLMDKVEAIREVVVAQQSFATRGFQKEELQLGNVIDDALAIYGPSLDRSCIVVEKLYREVPPLFLPKSKVIHVIINLIKNAAEAMEELAPRDRKILISIIRNGEQVHVRVSDKGVGIESADHQRIFSHGFTTKIKGHGFGLHACANAMTEMDGSIQMESKGKGKGACFVLQFPL